MDVIPVIDLKGGLAVHARQGERNSYAPIRSGLCEGSDPLDLARGYLKLFPFRRLYLADLDAIQGGRLAHSVIERLTQALPAIDLWLDCGLSDAASSRSLLGNPGTTLVIGSESLRDCCLLEQLADQRDRLVLSLDFQGDRFLGPQELWHNRKVWPERLIVMTLRRVGSNLGPDFERLRGLQERAPDHAIFAAGGVRHSEDMAHLAAQGLAGALIASALHDGRISLEDLTRLADATDAG